MIIHVDFDTGNKTVVEPMTEANRKKMVEVLIELYHLHQNQIDDNVIKNK